MPGRVLVDESGRDWRDRAACRYHDPELFYPKRRHGMVREREVARAAAICATCPVLADCRAWAFESGESWAVAGGLDFGIGRSGRNEPTKEAN